MNSNVPNVCENASFSEIAPIFKWSLMIINDVSNVVIDRVDIVPYMSNSNMLGRITPDTSIGVAIRWS